VRVVLEAEAAYKLSAQHSSLLDALHLELFERPWEIPLKFLPPFLDLGKNSRFQCGFLRLSF